MTRLLSKLASILVGLAFLGDKLLFPVAFAAVSHKLDNASSPAETAKLRRAVGEIAGHPQQAATQLADLRSPSAKAYLAYLYFTGKVPVSKRLTRVDSLMNEAIQQTADSLWREIDATKKYHYRDLETLLQHLRFITEAGPGDVLVPESIFKEHPIASSKAFDAFWYSSAERAINVACSPREDVDKIASVSRLNDIIGLLQGSPSLEGSSRFGFYRHQALVSLEASLAPAAFFTKHNQQDDELSHRLDQYMWRYSNQELWNKVQYEQWLNATRESKDALAKIYAQRFGWTREKAANCADLAINAINCAGLRARCISPDCLKEEVADEVYDCFSHSGLTVDQMRGWLHTNSLSKDELAVALRLAILNNASTAVISFLIDQGASLAGTTESALFMAARRPDLIALLLKRGAPVDGTNVLGKTALIQAVQYNNLDAVKGLVAAGADIQHAMIPVPTESQRLGLGCDYNYFIGNRTPLMYAAAWAGEPIMRYLLEQGANAQAVDSEGAKAEKYLAENNRLSKKQRQSLAALFHQYQRKGTD